MASPLAAIERFFERVFERPPARLFATRLEREFLQRELMRTIEADRQVRGRRTYIPTNYTLRFNEADLAAVSAQTGLAVELAESVRAYARSRNYQMGGRPTVRFEAWPSLEQNEVEVVTDGASVPPDGDIRPRPSRGALPPPRPTNNQPRLPDPSPTSTFEAAKPKAPNAALAVHVPGRAPWRVTVNGGRLRLGRALDNDLVLPDDRVSRHHGQISVRFGTLVYADLGSTNGSFVNGVRVSEIALGPTDVLQVGSSALTVESGQ
jgi:hypothetical protein